MNKLFRLAPLMISAVALLAAGCSHNKLIFTTRTSAGLDVSGTSEMPNKVSFTYNRQELSIVPRKTNGDAHSVYGGMDADVGWWSGTTIKQTFATGQAAEYASGGTKDLSASTSNAEQKPLIFCTATTFGLHLTTGDGQVQPNMLMGYRRWEGAYVPVPDPSQEVRPVYADIMINSKSEPTSTTASSASKLTTNWPSSSNGVRIKQAFATGSAAVNLSRDIGVQGKLSEAAGTLEAARALNIRRANDLRQEIILEVSKLKVDQLDAGAAAAKTAALTKDTSGFSALDSFEKSRQLRDIANGKDSESDLHKLEAYIVELRKLTKTN